MNLRELAQLGAYEDEHVTLSINEMTLDKMEGTLLYGCTHNRETFHVYLKDGLLNRIIYRDDGGVISVISGTELPCIDLVPNDRLYPEACDYETCLMLKLKGFALPFATYDDSRMPAVFHGKRLSDLAA